MSLYRASTSGKNAGLGQERPSELARNDDEYQMYRKRMMLAYKFRPNPLVSHRKFHTTINIKLRLFCILE